MPVNEPHIGELMMVAFNFAPQGWAFCNGQVIPIAQNTALFALLGTTYGGNGQTTFALPDLRGRVPMAEGVSSAGPTYVVGETGGVEAVTLLVSEIPAHTHPVSTTQPLAAGAAPCLAGNANQRTPVGSGLAAEASGVTALYASTHNADMSPAAVRFDGVGVVGASGGNLPHTNMQPFLAVNFCIALVGVFPVRPD